MSGAINGISANFTSNLSSNSGIYSDVAFFAKHNAGTSTVTGFNSIQGDANGFAVLNTSKGFRINFPSTAGFTHTLPDATGTIALTSNLSAYLPLSGGTLTGALNGTSATMSGIVRINTNTAGLILNRDAVTNFNGISLQTATVGKWFVGMRENLSSDNYIIYSEAGFDALTLNQSTGAATFSSSVTAGAIISTGVSTFSRSGLQMTVNPSYGGVDVYSQVQSTGALALASGGDNNRLYITSSGNVGIGTASPGQKLAVSDSGGVTRVLVENTGNAAAGAGLQMLVSSSGTTVGNGTIRTDNADNMQFFNIGGERMRITSVGNTQPGADNAYSLGVSGTRWSAVWAANGTIQTSDEREKKDIVDSDLGLDLITKLRPVSFKWKVGQNVVTSQVVKDEEGNPILDEEGNEKTESVLIPREGKRTHYGLIAQEVEEVLDGKDFGGFIHDEETDTKGLRYDQFVPLLIKSIQELNDKIAILESKLK
jgi:hypothetical protein